MKKRVLSLFLALTLCLGLLSLPAAAAGEVVASGYCGGEGDGTNLSWTLTADGTLTISGTGKMEDYYLIMSSAQTPWKNYRASITDLVVAEGVTQIGRYAFHGCGKLSGGKLTNVTLPETLTKIGEYAFAFCDALPAIDLPSGLIAIDDGAFRGCSALTCVDIPASVTSIGVGTYGNNGIPVVGSAFGECSSVTAYTVADENPAYTAVDGILFNKDKTTLIQYPIGKAQTTYKIPDGVTAIGEAAFAKWSALTNVEFPASLTAIGGNAFAYCDSLAEVKFPQGLTTIGEGAFYECDALTSIELPDSLTAIGTEAFAWCVALDSVKFFGDAPDGSGCFNLSVTAYYPKDNATWTEEARTRLGKNDNITWVPFGTGSQTVTSGYCGGEGDGTNLSWTLTGDGTLTIFGTGEMKNYDYSSLLAPWKGKQIITVAVQEGVTSIGDYAFYDNATLTNITLPNGLTVIGDYAFAHCETLEEIAFPGSLTSIGAWAFENCFALTDVDFSEGLTSIDVEAFLHCTALTKVNIPASVTSIGNYAFGVCSNLTAFAVTAGNPAYTTVDGVLFNKDKTTLIQYPIGNSCTTYTIPESVTTIDYLAFRECRALTEVIVPKGLTTINDNVFMDCSALTSVRFLGSAPETHYFDSYTGVFAGNTLTAYYPQGNTTWTEEARTKLGKNGNVTWVPFDVSAFESETYTVTVANTQHGKVTASPVKGTAGTKITLAVTPDNGYELGTLTVKQANGKTVAVAADNTFTMPTSNVTVTATFKAAPAATYTVTVTAAQHGKVTATPTTGTAGTKVTLTVTPDTGYELDALTVKQADGKTVTVAADNTFTMPASDVTVTATFKELPSEEPGKSEMRQSGGEGIAKLTREEIADLLRENPSDTPVDIFVTAPVCTAPYEIGEVKWEVLERAANRLNALRTLAGLPKATLDKQLCEDAQYGAVILGKLGHLSHYPDQPEDMDQAFYQRACAATASSNISAGIPFCATPDGFMDDGGVSNIDSVGHRRWQLNPSLGKVGFGYTETDSSYYKYTVEMVHDTSGEGCDYDFIGWPASGDFPIGDFFGVYTAWSVTVNPKKYQTPSAEEITVHLTREEDGATWSFSDPGYSDAGYFNVNVGGYGVDNCVIFSPDFGADFDLAGETYTVTIDGLKAIDGTPVDDFSYQVSFFDPEKVVVPGSGYCGAEGDGTNLTWTLTEDGALTISGAGAMADYNTEDTPWYRSQTGIVSVTVGEGVTTIGKWAFGGGKNLTEVNIADSVTEIKGGAFSSCWNLTEVELPANLKAIDGMAFAMCGLKEVKIPASVTYMGPFTFLWCDDLKTVTFYGDAPDGTGVFENESRIIAYYPRGNLTWTQEARNRLLVNSNVSRVTWLFFDAGTSGEETYTVTVTNAQHGTVTASPTTGTAGTKVTLTVTPDNGYELDTLTVKQADGTAVTVAADNTFTMPTSDVTVTPIFKELPPETYTVTVANAQHGKVTASPTSGEAGTKVTLTVTPDSGYELDTLTVKQADGTAVTVAAGNTFTMPTSDVAVTAIFKELPSEEPGKGEMRQSGGKGIAKLTREEIVALLNENPSDTPKDVFVTAPHCTAPYEIGEVKWEVLERVTNRLNALRTLAGLPKVTLDKQLCEDAQYGAVILGKLGYLSHTPDRPEDMDQAFYQRASAATSTSNIYAGISLCATPDGFMDDSDESNIDRVGHRRWQLNPAMGKVGFGYAETNSGYYRYTTEKVFDESGEDFDYDFVGWPASGDFPIGAFFDADTAWSVTVNPKKYQTPSAEEITVHLTREEDGASWTFSTLGYSDVGYFNVETSYRGVNNCVIFRPDLSGDRDLVGKTYTVTIDGLKTIDGTSVDDFSYQVSFFNPKQTVTPGTGGSTGGGGGTGVSTGGGGGGTGGGSSTGSSGSTTPSNSTTSQTFTDVAKGSWYESGVTFVVSKGLFNGVGANQFAPGTNMTRGMLMTVLARLAGQSTDGGATWYSKGMDWAKAQGISDGTDPNGNVTREQLVTMLYRYANSPAVDASMGMAGFTDVASISTWAQDAMRWAVQKGILTGKDGARLDPQGTATRAEVATILQRYVENK